MKLFAACVVNQATDSSRYDAKTTTSIDNACTVMSFLSFPFLFSCFVFSYPALCCVCVLFLFLSQCPQRNQNWQPANIRCNICGSELHPAADCPQRFTRTAEQATREMDSEYSEFMNEISGDGAVAQRSAQPLYITDGNGGGVRARRLHHRLRSDAGRPARRDFHLAWAIAARIHITLKTPSTD